MKIENFIKQINETDCHDIQTSLDKKYDGACPCFWAKRIINGKVVSIHGHCWRVCKECTSNGLHINSKLPKKDLMKIARALKKKLDEQKWYSPYEIKINLPKASNQQGRKV